MEEKHAVIHSNRTVRNRFWHYGTAAGLVVAGALWFAASVGWLPVGGVVSETAWPLGAVTLGLFILVGGRRKEKHSTRIAQGSEK